MKTTEEHRGRPERPAGARDLQHDIADRFRDALIEWVANKPRRSAAAFARAIGADASLIGDYQRGECLPADWVRWRAIADELSVSIDWLWCRPGAAKKSADVRLRDELAASLADYAATALQVPRSWVHKREFLDEVVAAQRSRVQQYNRETERWLAMFDDAGLNLAALGAAHGSPAFAPLVKACLVIFGAAIEGRRAAYDGLTTVRPPKRMAEQRIATLVSALKAAQRAHAYAGQLGRATIAADDGRKNKPVRVIPTGNAKGARGRIR